MTINAGHDMDPMIAAMSRDLREPTREEAIEAWQAASDRSCAGWLIFDPESEEDRDDAVRAYDSLVRERIETAFRKAIPPHERERLVDFVSQFAKRDDQHAGSDALDVVLHDHAEPLGRLLRWSSADLTLVSEIVDRFDVEVEERHLRLYDRSVALDAIGIRVIDQDGMDA